MPADEFDPFTYAADMKAHPENYVSMNWLMTMAKSKIAIRTCTNLEALKHHFGWAWNTFTDPEDRKELKALYEQAKARLK